MIRVLHVLNNLGSGGAEAFLMNIYRNIDRSKVQFDFLIRSRENNQLKPEIEAMGGKVYIMPPFPQKLFANYKSVDKFLRDNAKKYTAIHVHANALIYVKPLELAYKYNIPCRIIHSHNTFTNVRILHNFNKNRIDKWVTHRFACSDLAAEWMFENKEYCFVPNGVNLEKFSYCEQDRNDIREKYNLKHKFVVGNVGRLTPQKNHVFLLEIFAEIYKKNTDARLLLVGDGEDKEKIEKWIQEKRLSEAVIFTGAVSNVAQYMSAMDVFLMPSQWEGLPVVLVEAQANGLPCIISDVITEQVDVCCIRRLSLYDNVCKWADEVMLTTRIKKECSELLDTFDIRHVAKSLENFYLNEGGL